MNTPSTTKRQEPENGNVTRASVHAMEIYAGPIPSAGELKKYEDVLQGSADRILKMAENQAKHRREMESRMLEASIKAERAGQLFGFAIFTLALIAGIILILLGKDGAGLITSLGSLGVLIGLFIYNRSNMKNELKEKKK